VLNICFFFKENVSVLRRVNKANNPGCQGYAKDLRGKKSGRENRTPEEKPDFADLLTESITDSQGAGRLLGGLCAAYHGR
jgi:hypothetical protein